MRAQRPCSSKTERKLDARRQRRARRRPVLVRTVHRLGTADFPLLRNPVFLKEILSDTCGQLWYRRVVFWVPLLLFLCMITSESYYSKISTVARTAVVLMMIVVPAAAGGSLPREAQRGSLDLLRSTFLSRSDLIAGKFFAAIFSGSGVAFALLWAALFFLTTTRHADNLVPVMALVGTVAVVSLVVIAASATLAGAIARSATTALVLGYVSFVGVFLFVPIFSSLPDWNSWRTPICFSLRTAGVRSLTQGLGGMCPS